MKSITSISHLRWLPPPLVAGATTFPPQAGHYKAPLCGELLMKGLLCGALLSHRPAGGRWCRKAPKGDCISNARRAVVWFYTNWRLLSIHRRPTTTLAPKGETTHYDLCVALLLQIMFAVHARGASNLSPLRTFGPAGRQPSSPTGACPTHYLTLSFPFLFPFSFSDSLGSRDLSRK